MIHIHIYKTSYAYVTCQKLRGETFGDAFATSHQPPAAIGTCLGHRQYRGHVAAPRCGAGTRGAWGKPWICGSQLDKSGVCLLFLHCFIYFLTWFFPMFFFNVPVWDAWILQDGLVLVAVMDKFGPDWDFLAAGSACTVPGERGVGDTRGQRCLT